VLHTRVGVLLMSLPPFAATRVLFFTGKGGVGKTSLACATAVALADQGRRVLLVSTDPASNLDEVLATRLSSRPTPVPGAPGLHALNIDPEDAARAYRDRVIGPYRAVLPAAAVARMEEQLSGACTMEIAAFDEFTAILAGATAGTPFDHVIFDTAPTGHTLRLLRLPAAWTGFIDTNSTGTSCLGPLSGLRSKVDTYRRSLEALADGATTSVVLVSRPERSALREAARTSEELAALGVSNQRLAINGLLVPDGEDDPLAVAVRARGAEALATMPAGLRELPRIEVPLRARPPMGLDGLRSLFAPADVPRIEVMAEEPADDLPPPLVSVVDALEAGGRGVVLTMGKGGVGKTTAAAAIAVELAARGHRVHLTTTDPAAHVASTIAATVPGLHVSSIDPGEQTRAYRDEVLAAASASLDARGRELLEEDLRSPCTEEIAVFRAFARAVAGGEHGFVILDTAPTGHTLLLLDAAEAYHREVSRTSAEMPDAVRALLPRLRDPQFTRVLLVTVAEATPVHEAARLQDDLRRAGIQPFAWVINQSLAGHPTSDPVLMERGRREGRYIHEVLVRHAARVALVPWVTQAPVGAARLAALVREAADVPVSMA
jgi:arsenite-transporting ATPase